MSELGLKDTAGEVSTSARAIAGDPVVIEFHMGIVGPIAVKLTHGAAIGLLVSLNDAINKTVPPVKG